MKNCRNLCSFIVVVAFLLLRLVFHHLIQMDAPVHFSAPAPVPHLLLLTLGPAGSRLKPWGDGTPVLIPLETAALQSRPGSKHLLLRSSLLFLESAGSRSRSSRLSVVSALRPWNSRIDNKACSGLLAKGFNLIAGLDLVDLMFHAVLGSLEQGTASFLSLGRRPFYITRPLCLTGCAVGGWVCWLVLKRRGCGPDGRLVLNIFIFCRHCSRYNTYKCILHLIPW